MLYSALMNDLKNEIKLSYKIFLLSVSVTAAVSCAGCSTSESAEGITAHSTGNEATIITESEEVNTAMENAKEAYYRGDLETSADMYKVILSKQPGNRKALLDLLRLLYESGSYNEALKYLSDYRETVKSRNNTETGDLPLPIPDGALWEDPELPFFLSGNSQEYLKAVDEKYSEQDSSDKQSNNTEFRKRLEGERLFFSALAFMDEGEPEKAAEMLEKALDARGYFPSAQLILGQLYFDLNEPSLAAKHLNTALKDDSNQTSGRITIAKTILAGGRLSEGYEALKKAAAIRPWDRETEEFLKKFEENNPDIIKTEKRIEKRRRITADVPQASVFTPEPEKMPSIRIGLAENLRELFIKPGGDFIISDISGSILAEREKNEVLKISFSNSGIIISTEEDELIMKHQGSVDIITKSNSDTVLMFNVVHSTGYLSAGSEDRAYRGRISLRSGSRGITVVNTLPLEEYLYSVVPSEIPSFWPEEALCAQAVAARSYTLANMGKYIKKGYDVTGSIESHFYRGFTGENERTTSAVEKTRGKVLKAEGKYLNAFYSANSAGRTESAESVWGGKYPLTGVTDPQLSFESDPPSPYELARWILSEPETYSSHPKYYYRSSYRWRLIVTAAEIEARTGYSAGKIRSIETAGRGKSGRVEKIIIKGTDGERIIKGDKIRKSLGGLRSSLFIMMPKLDKEGMPEYFIFAGAGWGHGVGMCQTGAAGMAHEGFSYQQILSHYYPAAELSSIY